MPDNNELILIDSSSEEEGSGQVTKKFKPNPNASDKSNFAMTPFKDVSSSEDEDEEEENGYDNSKSIDDDDDSDEEEEGLAMQSNRAPSRSGITEPSQVSLTSETSSVQEDVTTNGASDASSSSEDDLEPNFNFNDIPPELITETRKFLKEHGNIAFLEKYLPTAASIDDIIRLILQLGFVPKNLPRPHSVNIMEYIKILNHAMMKVKSLRNRKDDVCTVEDALNLISKSNKILVITGAGISTSLGIPDFRSSRGFYSMVKHLGLSDPQEVFDLELFHVDPSLFYSIAHMILPPEQMFSPMHSFIKVLQDKGKLLRNYTQNIDNLESYAGIKKENLVQCHGSFATASCVTCGVQVDGEEIFEQIRSKTIPVCPDCTKRKDAILKKNDDYYFAESYGVFKPDITFFGEALPSNFHDHIREDILECDLLICAGTSLKVAPVSDIVDKVPEKIPQILINKDPIDHCHFDVSLLGYCDDVASYIANKLGESWSLPHKDFSTITGENGENLEIELVDVVLREFQVINKSNTEEEEPTEPGILTIENTPIGDDSIPPIETKENTPAV